MNRLLEQENVLNLPGSLFISRLSCLFSSYVIGLAVSTSSSLSTSSVFFLAAILPKHKQPH